MTLRLKPLKDQVMVITGASSGIGLATARAAARRGARLVLASRSDEDLRQLVDEVRREGCHAVHVTADVGSEADVRRIAEIAQKAQRNEKANERPPRDRPRRDPPPAGG